MHCPVTCTAVTLLMLCVQVEKGEGPVGLVVMPISLSF